MRRLVIAAAVGAAVVATAVPSFAAQSPTPRQTSPVGVTVSTDGGVFVGTTFEGRPLLAASVAGGQVCVGLSLEVPFCTPPVAISDNIPRDIDLAVGPAYASVHTSNGIAVSTGLTGQPLVSAGIGNGWLCIGFSEEIPFCYPLTQNTSARVGHPVTY